MSQVLLVSLFCFCIFFMLKHFSVLRCPPNRFTIPSGTLSVFGDLFLDACLVELDQPVANNIDPQLPDVSLCREALPSNTHGRRCVGPFFDRRRRLVGVHGHIVATSKMTFFKGNLRVVRTPFVLGAPLLLVLIEFLIFDEVQTSSAAKVLVQNPMSNKPPLDLSCVWH